MPSVSSSERARESRDAAPGLQSPDAGRTVPLVRCPADPMRALLALLALGVLLTVHELAHLLAARVFGTRAIVFSFGIGPPLFGFRALGQRWALGAIPFGGWLRLEGENPHGAARASGVPFAALSVGRRLAVFAAGPLGSWAVAVLLLTGLFAAGTHHPVGMA